MANRIIEYFSIKKQDREEFIKMLDSMSSRISEACAEYADIFKDSGKYVDIRTTNAWKQRFSNLYDNASSYLKNGMIEKKKPPRKYIEVLAKMDAMYSHIDEQRVLHNRHVTSGEHNSALKAFEGLTGGGAPSDEQLEAVISQDKYILITGAPSTGKSTALKARMKYISEKHRLSPDSVLYIDASDIDRIAEIAAGLLKKCNIDAAPLTARSTYDLIKEYCKRYINEKMNETSYRGRIVDYYMKFHSAGHTVLDFEDMADYEKYIKLRPPVSLRGERLKSYEELDIANFLYALGVKYEYHAPFKIDVPLHGSRTVYRSDFTLTDYGICVNVYKPEEEERAEEISAIHEEAEVPLIQLSSRDRQEGNMLSKLQAEMRARGVSYSIRTDAELIENIMKTEPDFIELLTESICAGAEAMLSSEMSEDMLLELSRAKSKTALPLYRRHERMMSLILPFYNYYVNEVPSDAYRLTSRAASVIHDTHTRLDYRHIFIDNIENINACSMHLVKALAAASPCSVTAAGCQWTSCTGIRGADSMYMSELGRFLPGTCEIECRHVYNMPAELFCDMRELAERSGGYMGYKPLIEGRDARYRRYSYADSGSAAAAVSMKYADTDKLSAFIDSLPEECLVLAVCRHKRDFDCYNSIFSNISKASGRSIECVCLSDMPSASGTDTGECLKYDTVIWVNTKYTDFGFPDERLCLNNISPLILRLPPSAVFDAERRMLCRAMSRASGKFVFLYDEEDVSDLVAELL